MLDFRINTFLSVCKNMSYTKAAEELGLTQPAVSQHIKFLEEFYGAKLFNYNSKKLTLTEQGQYLKSTMESFAHDNIRVRDTIAQIVKRQELNIGVTMSIGESYFPPRLSRFMDAHTELNINVIVADTRQLLEQLDRGELDIILCEGYFKKSHYNYHLIKREEICCFCKVDYNISNSVNGIECLFEERLLLREEGSGTRRVFERMMEECGYEISAFSRCCEINNPHLIVQMLLAGQGISFLYRSVGDKYVATNELRKVKVKNFTMEHEFNVVWKLGSIFEKEYKEYINEIISG